MHLLLHLNSNRSCAIDGDDATNSITGIILERHYVYHMCGPTRSATMSGRLPYHGNQDNGNDLNSTSGVDLRMTFLPAKLKQAGYATSMIGKSHLGARSIMHLPIHRGFDRHFGFLGGGTYNTYAHGGSYLRTPHSTHMQAHTRKHARARTHISNRNQEEDLLGMERGICHPQRLCVIQ